MMENTDAPSSSAAEYPRKILLVIAFVLFCNLFLYRSVGALGSGLFLAGCFVFIVAIYVKKLDLRRFWPLTAVTGGFVALVILALVLTASGLAQAVLLWSLFLVASYYLYLVAAEKTFFEDAIEIVLAPISGVAGYIISFIGRIEDYLSGRLLAILPLGIKPEFAKALVRVVVGALISLPVILILLGLLTSGDPIFGKEVGTFFSDIGRILSWQFWQEPVVRVIVSIVFFGALLPLAFLPKLKRIEVPITDRFVPKTELAVLVLMVVILLGAFIIIQWPYVFASVPKETDLSKFGVATYSEYVKRGFGEFIMVAVIVYGISRLSLGVLKKITGGKILAALQGILLLEFVVFLISIFRRVYLYQEFHGWSLGRVYGVIFLVFVLAMVIVLIGRYFSKKNLLVVEVILVLGLALGLGFFNAEGFLVSRPPTVNGRTDHVYLARLGSGGVEGWKEAYGWAGGVLSEVYLGEEVEIKTGEVVSTADVVGEPQRAVVPFKTTVINREDRREIAYAGNIIKALLMHYHELVNRYATPEEKRAYYRTIIGFSEPASSSKSLTDEEIEKKAKRLGSSFWIDPGNRTYTYLADRKSYYYEIPEDQGPPIDDKESSYLDRLYNFNESDYRAHKILQEDMPIEKVLDILEKYIELHNRIYNQPEVHRDHDSDISFEGPFLRL